MVIFDVLMSNKLNFICIAPFHTANNTKKLRKNGGSGGGSSNGYGNHQDSNGDTLTSNGGSPPKNGYANGNDHGPGGSQNGNNIDYEQPAQLTALQKLKPPQMQQQQQQLVASLEMCYFCFDVLYAHLYHKNSPSRPTFTNNQL